MKFGLIVEGHGEVQAAPILVRRLAQHLGCNETIEVLKPHRIHRQQIVKVGELERAVEFMARKVGEGGKILVLLDADEDCPAQLGPMLQARALTARSDRQISVVLANREFEAWFLAAAGSIRGKRSLAPTFLPPELPERVSSPKAVLDARMGENGYSETLDQPAFSAELDLSAARSADSFDKLVRELGALLAVAVPPRPSPH